MSIGEAASDDVAIKPRPRAPDDSEMDITPMIDITFLLLIFFLVASKMDQPAPVVLPEARNGGAVATKNAIVLTLKQGGGKSDALIYKGDGGNEADLLKAKDPIEQENEVVAYIEAAIVADPSKSQVVIKAEKAVRNKDVGRVAKAVGRVNEIQGLHVAVLEVQ